jgi:hypothetical protein
MPANVGLQGLTLFTSLRVSEAARASGSGEQLSGAHCEHGAVSGTAVMEDYAPLPRSPIWSRRIVLSCSRSDFYT